MAHLTLRTNPNPTLDWGDEVAVDTLWRDSPGAPGLGSQNTRENNASTVLRMTYGAFAFLFMGDAEGKNRTEPATINHNPAWRLGSTQEGTLVLSESDGGLNFWLLVGPEKEKNSFRPSGNVMSPPFPLSNPFLAR